MSVPPTSIRDATCTVRTAKTEPIIIIIINGFKFHQASIMREKRGYEDEAE